MIQRPRSDRFFAGFSKQVSKEYGVLLERLGAALRREPFTVAGIPTDYMVPEEGVEPSRPCGYGILSQIEKGRKP